MALNPAFVNGTEIQHTSTSAISLSSLIQEVLAGGKPTVLGAITRFPESQKGTPARWRWVSEKGTADSHRRWFTVILERSTDTISPANVELFVEEKDLAASLARQHYILIGLDGALKGCGFALVPLEKDGKYIPGPSLAPFKFQDIKSSEVRARFQRELDFWLKGVGRKSRKAPDGEKGAGEGVPKPGENR